MILRWIFGAFSALIITTYINPAQAGTLQEDLTKSLNNNVVLYLRIEGETAASLSRSLRANFSARSPNVPADLVGQEFAFNCWKDDICLFGLHQSELRPSSQLDPTRSVVVRYPVSDGARSLDVVITLRPARRGATVLNLKLLGDQGSLLWQENVQACRFVESREGRACEIFEAGIGPRYGELPLTDAMFGRLLTFTARLQGRPATVLFQKLADQAKIDVNVKHASALFPDGKSSQLYQVGEQLACIQFKSHNERQTVCNARVKTGKNLGRQEIARLPQWIVSLEPRFQASQFRQLQIDLEVAGQKQSIYLGSCPLKIKASIAVDCEVWVDPYPIDEAFPPFTPPVQGVAVGWRTLLER